MRISDWSSDVCSSDLPARQPAIAARNGRGLADEAVGRAVGGTFAGRALPVRWRGVVLSGRFEVAVRIYRLQFPLFQVSPGRSVPTFPILSPSLFFLPLLFF